MWSSKYTGNKYLKNYTVCDLLNDYWIIKSLPIIWFRVFTNKEPDEVSIIETPYGGRIAFVLPEGNMLYVHLKDKQLIRNKKRWSQVR